MLRKVTAVVVHLVMLALVCAIGAYWGIRIMTPAPANSPPAPTASGPREADPVLAARMFGLVQAAPTQTSLNVQAIGAIAAGPDSAAVLVVDGKPARVYLLNQEVEGGARLVAIGRNAVTIERGGVRREIALPPPPPGFMREGATLSAPTVEGTVKPVTPPQGEPIRSRIRRQ
jgi:general secretion pathway protein C